VDAFVLSDGVTVTLLLSATTTLAAVEVLFRQDTEILPSDLELCQLALNCAVGNRTLPHAVASAGNNSYAYRYNGNMTTRTLGGNNSYTFSYDSENRLSGVSGAATNSYIYDGDSKRVNEVTYENLAAGIPLTSGGSLYFAEAATKLNYLEGVPFLCIWCPRSSQTKIAQPVCAIW
jgi:hypothetical protein